MHEVGLITEAIKLAESAAREAGASRIQRLTFALAPGGHVTRDSVETLFAALSSGTMAEGAEVELEWAQARRYCLECSETIAGGTDTRCPMCGHALLTSTEAPELVLTSIDVDQATVLGGA